MATILTHPIIPLTLGLIATRAHLPVRLILIGMLCSILPDLDVIGFRFQIPYDSELGHRGITHSLFFAAILATAITFRTHFMYLERSVIWLYLFVSTISHGLLDALTNGGLGVGFFLPFKDERYFFPQQLIEVSPIGSRFFSERGWVVLQSELIYVITPCLLLILLHKLIHHFLSRTHTS